MSAQLVIAPEAMEDVWTRVDVARVAMDARTTHHDAGQERTALALVLADTLADRCDPAAALLAYQRAREAHERAATILFAARDDLLAARGGPSARPTRARSAS